MFRYTYILLVFLVLMYGFIPLSIFFLSLPDFLIGDFYEGRLLYEILFWSLCSAFMISPILARKRTVPAFNELGSALEFIGKRMYLVYLVGLVLLGLLLRSLNADRAQLLAILSSTFLPGMGFVLLLFYLKFYRFSKIQKLFVCLLLLFVDFLFMGKQYAISLVIIFAFLLDFYKKRVKLWQMVLGLVGGIMFIFLINSTRGDFSVIDLSSTFMEFRGVLSSIQFADQSLNLFNFGAFRQEIEEYCIHVYGYNLAFHPLLFFKSITPYVYLNVSVYCLLTYFLIHLLVRYLGVFGVLIVAINFIHYLRHGIDIFLIKIISQALFVFLLTIKLKSTPTYGLS